MNFTLARRTLHYAPPHEAVTVAGHRHAERLAQSYPPREVAHDGAEAYTLR
jgi:hypothetical protein